MSDGQETSETSRSMRESGVFREKREAEQQISDLG